jgi:hypothetical protein
MKERKATRDSELKGSELTVYHTAHSIRWIPNFRRNILLPKRLYPPTGVYGVISWRSACEYTPPRSTATPQLTSGLRSAELYSSLILRKSEFP